ncbi:hypothetical protein SAMN05443247_03125 [Bradyrhizobium erythrophlei]|nr:hypothetical protein SAMN05443247_03125 [Bradyrhizobium erythrophlei]
MFTVLSILRNIRKRRRRAALLRALARAHEAKTQP